MVTTRESLPTVFVATTVNVKLPGVVRVPVSIPVPGARLKPGGRLVIYDQVGTGAPSAINIKLYTSSTSPPWALYTVITGGAVEPKVIGLKSEPPILVAWIVKLKSPVPVKVPDSTPVIELRCNPWGNVPVYDQVGAGTPDATKVWLKAAPSVAGGNVNGAITGAIHKMIVTCRVWLPAKFSAVTLKVRVPASLRGGLPDSTPLTGSNTNPAGNPVADQVNGSMPE